MSYAEYIRGWTGVSCFDNYRLGQYCNKFSIKQLKFIFDIMNLACEQFYYENLPSDIDSRIIEQALFFRNNLCFYYDEAFLQPVLFEYGASDNLNLYVRPNKVRLTYLNGTQYKEVFYKDIVPIYDNSLDIPPFIIVLEYINQLVTTDLSFDINMINLRLPFIFSGDKTQNAELKKMYQEINNFEPVFFTSNKKLNESIKNFDTKTDIKPMDILDVEQKIKDNVLKIIGVYTSISKKERVITGEQESNNDYVNMMYQMKLKNRKKAIEEVNKRWNTNIVLKELYQDVKEQEVNNIAMEEKAKSEAINND